MILTGLRDLANREGLLQNADYEPKAVAWILSIGDEGKFLGVIPTAAEDKRGKARAKILDIPRRKGRTVAPVADFAVDKSEYVLGIEPDGKRSADDLATRLDLFRQEIAKGVSETGHPALAAVQAFLARPDERQSAIEVINDLKYASNDLFAFEYRGELVHELPEVRKYFSESRNAAKQGEAQCLACGALRDVSRKHPAIQIPGGTTSGVALVSFNSDAFESYGLDGNENAPVCQACADAYTTALKRLVSDRYPDPKNPGQMLPRRSVRLAADTTALFWADREASIVDLLSDYFAAPSPDAIKSILESPWRGRAPAAVSNRFYCLILTGGQGRAIVRGLHTETVDDLEHNIRAYFDAIDLGSDASLSLTWMLRSLVLQGKLENLPPGLASEVFLAIVFGRQYPQTLLARAVERCRAERRVPRERAALIRAYMIRNCKLEVTVALDAANPNEAYRLGRLMALLERIQSAAHNNPNKTIVDRFYGAASTRPVTVFPRLIGNAQHHLAKLNPGLSGFYHSELADVLGGLASFPSTLNLEQQGMSALGYYHQKSFRKQDSEDAVSRDEAAKDDTE
jgi:CRISPR-associated protein Csd1